MKRYLLAVTVASSLALAFAVGCGSSGGGGAGTAGSGGTSGTKGGGGTKGSGGSAGSGGGSFNCSYTAGTYEECFSYTGLSSEQTSAEQTACKAFPMSSTPSSCPSGATDTCENIPLTGTSITYGYAIYKLPSTAVASEKMACTELKGTWK